MGGSAPRARGTLSSRLSFQAPRPLTSLQPAIQKPGRSLQVFTLWGELPQNPELLRPPGWSFICVPWIMRYRFSLFSPCGPIRLSSPPPPRLAPECPRPPAELPPHTRCLSRDPHVACAQLIRSHGCTERASEKVSVISGAESNPVPPPPTMASVVPTQVPASRINRFYSILALHVRLSLPESSPGPEVQASRSGHSAPSLGDVLRDPQARTVRATGPGP